MSGSVATLRLQERNARWLGDGLELLIEKCKGDGHVDTTNLATAVSLSSGHMPVLRSLEGKSHRPLSNFSLSVSVSQ